MENTRILQVRILLYENVRNILRFIRVKHWVKNMAVFIPVFFAAQGEMIFSSELIMLYFAFCFAASTIYVINDIVDLPQDQMHPEKRNRPLASGFFSLGNAYVTIAFLLIPLSFLLVKLDNSFFYVLLYILLNLLYSFKLKKLSIVDVSCISLGFILRILAGGAAVGIYVSNWLIVIVFLSTLSLALAKRRDDLYLKGTGSKEVLRKALGGYTVDFLNVAISITLSITLIAYIIYSVSPEVMERMNSDKVYVTSLFVFLGVMRYLQITIVENKSGSPVSILWRDRFIQLNIIMWLLTFYMLLYGKGF